MKRAVWILVACWLAGCSKPLLEPSVATKPPSAQQGLRAGVAEIDITPPPGLSLAGHGPEGRVARGHRGRLRCRALFAADRLGENLAWVVCDLWAPSALLHRRVARLLAAETGLSADRLILSATHTHGGPAHYMGASAYSGSLSSEQPGFDEKVLNWLAGGIVKVVSKAREDALAGGDAKLTWHFGQTRPGLTRNRSLEAHCKNQDSDGKSVCGDAPDAVREVDRQLPVLLVERGQKLHGVFAVAAMHPTALPNTNEVYHADVFGIATRKLHHERGDKVVFAIANGLEGDVSPNVTTQSWSEAERIGHMLAGDVMRIVADGGKSATGDVIKRAYREVELSSTAPGEIRLCPSGALGDVAAGGAEDGRTRFYAIARAREGAKLCPPRGCHGPKRSLTAPITKRAFPSYAPMHVAELGGALLVTLPFEMTTSAGQALREKLQKQAGQRPVVLVGLTNDYLQYVTTEAEYRAQHYEGASVLYGPSSAAFFSAHASQLLTDWSAEKPPVDLNTTPAREFDPEPHVERFGPSQQTPPRSAYRQPFQVDGQPRSWAFEWSVPSKHAESETAGRALVRIQKKDGAGWVDFVHAGAPVDDTEIAVWVKQRRALPHYYNAVWQLPLGLHGEFRFVVGHGPNELRSGGFSP